MSRERNVVASSLPQDNEEVSGIGNYDRVSSTSCHFQADLGSAESAVSERVAAADEDSRIAQARQAQRCSTS